MQDDIRPLPASSHDPPWPMQCADDDGTGTGIGTGTVQHWTKTHWVVVSFAADAFYPEQVRYHSPCTVHVVLL